MEPIHGLSDESGCFGNASAKLLRNQGNQTAVNCKEDSEGKKFMHWSKHTPLGDTVTSKGGGIVQLNDLISASSSTFLSDFKSVSMAGLSILNSNTTRTAKKKRHLCAYTPSTERSVASNFQ